MEAAERRSYNAVRTQETLSPTDTGSTDHSFPTDHPIDTRGADSFSVHSRTPLASSAAMSTYPPPPMPQPGVNKEGGYDAESRAGSQTDLRQRQSRHGMGGSSWDLLSGIKNFEAEYETYDSRKASEAHLAFAEGDLPNTKVGPSSHASRQTYWD
jgi:hypothetical protein